VRRFINGILVGSVLGGMIGLMVNGNLKPQRKKMLGNTKKLSKQASRIVEEVTHDVTNLIKRR